MSKNEFIDGLISPAVVEALLPQFKETCLALHGVGSEQCRHGSDHVSLPVAMSDLQTVLNLTCAAVPMLYQIRNVLDDAIYFALRAKSGHAAAIEFFDHPDLTLVEWEAAFGEGFLTEQLKQLFDIAHRFAVGIPLENELSKIGSGLARIAGDKVFSTLEAKIAERTPVDVEKTLAKLKGKPEGEGAQ
jgi:hypothetical protein